LRWEELQEQGSCASFWQNVRGKVVELEQFDSELKQAVAEATAQRKARSKKLSSAIAMDG